jgi:3-hydroxyethyl bacteriochlorophyllide a dehydrogenase
MKTAAVVLDQPERLSLRQVELDPAGDAEVIVDIAWSGISTGTERLLWNGRMPDFPGMGYPLVPGYESVGRVVAAGPAASLKLGEQVFVPGARCYGAVRGLFGGAAARVVVPGARVIPVSEHLGEKAVLLALAATAQHAIAAPGARAPDLIVGHGVLGRLLARLTIAAGHPAPMVWERNPQRARYALGYSVIAPDDDLRRDYQAIYDVSGDASLLDALIGRLAPGGEIVLAGFYEAPLSFAFPPAFMREARLRVAAQWREADLIAVKQLAESGALSLDGLITHRQAADEASSAYRTAFGDSACLKMILDWRGTA